MASKSGLERRVERGIFAARWLLAPIYLGLALALTILLFVFLRELVSAVSRIPSMQAEDAILAVLSLIDISLAGNLILIVLFSGYETFVSSLGIQDQDRPAWMGTVDYSGMKLKLIGSIVAISAIHLLKWFMEIQYYESGEPIDEPQLFWLVVIHLTFVATGVLVALTDLIATRHGGK